jgi:integrase
MTTLNRLTSLKVKAIDKPGRHADGGNLYVVCAPSGSKTWSFLYRQPGTGKQREAGFGSVEGLTLKEARERAREGRAMLAKGQDPITVWKGEKAAKRALSFEEAAQAHFEKKFREWRNQTSGEGERSLLYKHAAKLMKLPVDMIDANAVLAVLKPVWTEKPDMSRRLRARIEAVLNVGYVMLGADKANPARWKGHLDHLLPRPRKATNHAALSYAEVPEFIAELRARDDVYSLALEFLILTGTRASETLQARWSEFGDLNAKTWVIPATRMKAFREHRVPLSDRAVEILKERRVVVHEDEALVFRGPYAPLNVKGLERVIAKLGLAGKATPHGFRSSLRDWISEQTATPHAVAEMCLAHKIGDSTVQAYAWSDLLEQRRPVMQLWAKFLEGLGGEVVPFRTSDKTTA